MAATPITEISLPDEAKAVVWRIFGAGASPLTEQSTFDLIEPIICKHVTSSYDRDRSVATIRGWFEIIGEQRYVKQDLQEAVANVIVEGIGVDPSEIGIWAIGSINGGLAANIIRSRRSLEEIDTVVDATLATLEKVCDNDAVLDADGIVPFAGRDSNNAKIPRDAVRREGMLETFQHLSTHGLELVHLGLHPPVGNLIKLVIDLQPERFQSLVERLDHPVMQARATYHILEKTRNSNHREPLSWITKESCDALIALATMHTLETVNSLDRDIESSDRLSDDQHLWNTELRPPRDDLDSAAVNLIDDIVDRLAMLEPPASAKWIGELLSGAPYILSRGGNPEKQPRVERLEKKATERLAHHVRHSWSDDLVASLCVGLRLTPRDTWTRHLADIAWEVRDTEPERAAMLSRTTLIEHERHVDEEMERGHMYYNWDDWHDREWITGLGIALALSTDELEMPQWVATRCQALPLTVWDAEESYGVFSAADRAAQIWFIVAFHAVAALKQIGQPVEPRRVCDLAEAVWSHCHFAGQHLPDGRDASVAAEYAARFAIEFGEPSILWLLKQARSRAVGPRAVWALIDQRNKKAEREGRPDAVYDQGVIDEMASAASTRFRDGEHLSIESLHYLGQLWLLLGVMDLAHPTAKAILAHPSRTLSRNNQIVALELLAQATDGKWPDLETSDCISSTYRDLWPTHGYTPDSEVADRKRIDELIESSGFPAP